MIRKKYRKYIIFLVPIEKEVTRIDKNGKEIKKTIFCRLQFIDSVRFMARPLSNLVNNLAERINKIKCKYGHGNKNCKTFGIKHKNCKCCLKYKNVKDDLIEYTCLFCNKNYHKKFDEKLNKQFC